MKERQGERESERLEERQKEREIIGETGRERERWEDIDGNRLGGKTVRDRVGGKTEREIGRKETQV